MIISSLKIILSLLIIKIVYATKISTPQGEVEGIIKKTVTGYEIEAFLGIPFAKPPVGQLRFKSPVPFGKWKGIWNASKDGNECMQRAVFSTNEDSLNQTTPEVNDLGPDQIPSLPITGSEDCLYLNVFTPSISIPKKYPVMFYIHGGAFVCGSSYSKFYGPDYILDIEDIVIVATNYRVGPLGFASTEDSVMSGNYGMKDLVLALKWVQENIASYGGNPDSVTIFGGSAGGASVHYLMLSTLAKGLFHRAIPMSGAAHCPWSTFIPGEVANNTQKLASFLNCPTEPSTLLVECLRKVPAEKFIEVDSKFQIFKGTPFVSHVPVVEPEEIEDAFLTENPLTAKSSVPMMIGVTKDEGIMFGAHFYSKDGLALLNTRLNEILPVGLFYDKSSNKPDEITKKIREFYFGDVNKLITKENFKGLIDLHGDSLFVECVSSAVKNHEGTAYLYMFAHKGNVSLVDIAQDDFTKFGVSHVEDHVYLFPVKFFSQKERVKLEGKDKKMSEELIKLWTNFAKYGNPTPNNEDNKWEEFSIKDMNYYHIEYGKTRMEKDFFKERINFWKNSGWRDKLRSKISLIKT